MATHSSILAWKISWSLLGYSPWGHRVRHNWMTNTFTLISLDGQISLPSAEPRAQLGEGKKMKKKWAWLACEGGGVKGADGSSESNAGEGGTKQYWGKDYALGVGRAATNLLRSLWTIDLGSPVCFLIYKLCTGQVVTFLALRQIVCLCVCVSLCVCRLSYVWLFATPWTVARQASLFLEFSRQEY